MVTIFYQCSSNICALWWWDIKELLFVNTNSYCVWFSTRWFVYKRGKSIAFVALRWADDERETERERERERVNDATSRSTWSVTWRRHFSDTCRLMCRLCLAGLVGPSLRRRSAEQRQQQQHNKLTESTQCWTQQRAWLATCTMSCRGEITLRNFTTVVNHRSVSFTGACFRLRTKYSTFRFLRVTNQEAQLMLTNPRDAMLRVELRSK